MLEIRLEIGGCRMVSAVCNGSQLNELASTEACRAGCPRTLPGSAQSPGCLPKVESSRRINDVLIAARNNPKHHSERPTGLTGGNLELGQKLSIRFILRERPLHEAKLVVVLNRRGADNDVAERQVPIQPAGRSRADYNPKIRYLIDQVLSVHRELCLPVSPHHQYQAELLEEVAIEPPQGHAPRLVASGHDGPDQGLKLLGLRHSYESLDVIHWHFNSPAPTLAVSGRGDHREPPVQEHCEVKLPSRLIPHRHHPRAELQPAHELQVDTLR